MSIIRAPRPEGNFYLLNKAISEDCRLSWGARGMLVFLLGKPDHWKVSPAHLRGETVGSAKPTGRDGIYGLLDELISAGYVRREQPRSESGVLGEVTYLVSESPLPDSPYTAEPLPAEPLPAGPHTANPTLVSIEGKQGLKKPASTESPAGTGRVKTGKFDPLTAKPANASDQAWADFCEMRKAKRAPLTLRACELIAKKLANHPEPDAVLDRSTTSSWSDIYPESVLPGAGATNGKPSAFNNLPQHTPDMYQESHDGRSNF
ncbi:hypothetical protein [Pseudomonas donghuensis]|uniref:hypothetical protein n=1 Tax=Pseudomonas donghuensis TaxID=1163398 RepID=UPI001CB92548|nr:hypothetical protein [Pseudomonas donghuensis]WKY29642.1 hypothetical protein QYF67_06480 [Pseudomonas donghuensis]